MKLMMGGRELRHFEADLSANSSIVLADGTLWSHAATMGTIFYRGSEFNIDQATIENFVKVFTSGYPTKIPVDYEHASTDDDPEVRKLRAQGKVPKAGDVAELRGVFSADEFTGDLKAAAEKLAALDGRSLDDPRNLGLWMRWKPTANALSAIKAEEYSELSIAFDDNWPDKRTGTGQGPTILAVGLVSRPFLDEMLSVAASSGGDSPPAKPASHENTMTTNNTSISMRLLSLVAAVRNKPVATEDEAISELTAHQGELTELRALAPFREVISAEFSNEKDPAKIVGTIRELRSKVATAELAAKDAKAKELKTTVDATMEKHKSKLTAPLRALMATQLTSELEAGAKIEDTQTVKALESMKALSIFSQDSVADVGGAGADDGVKIDARAKELMANDGELKELRTREGHTVAFRAAIQRAKKELSAN
jgi:biotin carboxyl carrier protein